ncbi:hypothetical protein TSOC_002406 [Tetrabaena socialis]|uniref:Histidine phosphatase family protein n=1 Tax=Tetrabaena socialis TaxID=47790 RepID=A0A2J8AEC3_9CHLO|nr:hypothetical protein TSOC_002406 [Tetrabaena socialis]|eukprot:PNH10867.1 hypothetical protein TSOC_002406 [Tetrabaena socialis]
MPLKNEYFLLRHGRSLANEAEIIVSSPDNGRDEQWTLAPAGEDQARAAGHQLAQALLQGASGRPDRPVRVLSSPFSRTMRTAALAAEAAGLAQPGSEPLVQRLESELQAGSVVLLVSHGDTLSILQAAMSGADTRQHRRFAFETAELRQLRPAADAAD